MFDARGIVPLGYAAFAFALGVTVGMLIRRTVPAMAITLAVFVAVQIAMPQRSGHTSRAGPLDHRVHPREHRRVHGIGPRGTRTGGREAPGRVPGACPATRSTRPERAETIGPHPSCPRRREPAVTRAATRRRRTSGRFKELALCLAESPGSATGKR